VLKCQSALYGYRTEKLPLGIVIENLPDWLVVKVPNRVDKQGDHGVSLGGLAKG
jgi:hypothetical protein